MDSEMEKIARAWKDEQDRWMLATYSPAGNETPSYVYRMVNAHEDDHPTFTGHYWECQQFIERHCARAAFAATVEQLRPWLSHHYTCPHGTSDKPFTECSCGLSAALAGGKR